MLDKNVVTKIVNYSGYTMLMIQSILILAKLFAGLHISWWWVLSPLFLVGGLYILVLLSLLLLIGIIATFVNKGF